MRDIARWLFYLTYLLERHYLLQFPLRRWLWGLVLLPPLLTWWRVMDWAWAAVVSALAALTLAATGWARHRQDAIFKAASSAASLGNAPPVVDEQIQGWAYGRFEVEGREAYLANVEAHLSYVPTREHVVMARVRRTRFLLLALSPADEVGWWYAFFAPGRVRRVKIGHICWGPDRRPGLAIHYLPDDREGEETLYLAFPDEDTVGRIVADLQRDVPVQAFKPAGRPAPTSPSRRGIPPE